MPSLSPNVFYIYILYYIIMFAYVAHQLKIRSYVWICYNVSSTELLSNWSCTDYFTNLYLS